MKFKSRQELAKQLGISRNTLLNRLKGKNIEVKRGLLSPEEQKKILKALGVNTSDKGKAKG